MTHVSPPRGRRRWVLSTLAALLAVTTTLSGGAIAAAAPGGPGAVEGPAAFVPGFTHGRVEVEGTNLHYVRGGSGPPLVLLHGWPQTWQQWRPVMPALAERFTVIAFDLPGLGDSTSPAGGYDKATTAKRIREGVQELGLGPVSILAHDVGALVAHPYARDFPAEVTRLAVLETPLPGYGLEDLFGISWHLGFNSAPAPVPETIMDNEDVPTYLGWLFSGTRHPQRIDQQAAFRAYASPARRTAGYEYYRAFPADAADNRAGAARPLPMPVLAMGAQYAFGPAVAGSFRQVATDVREVVAPDSGHWIAEENPTFLADCAALFFGPAGVAPSRPELEGCRA